jgi:hypothetical protein
LSRTSTTTAATSILSFLVWTGIAVAQPPSSPPVSTPPVSAPAAANQTADNEFRKGAFYWRFLGGASLPIEYKDSSSDRKMGLMDVEFGRVLTSRHGPGPLAGQFEYVVQAQPLVVRGPDHFNGIGLTPILLRWNFAGGRQVRPIAEVGSGFMLIKWPDPAPNQLVLNFYEQIGFGVQIGSPSKTSLAAGFRYQHISNGGRAHPSTGTDAYIVYAGVSFPHQSTTAANASQAGGPGAPGAPTESEPRWPAQGLSFAGGTGLIRSISPDTLEPGNFAVGALEMNYDRGPGDIDFFTYSFQFAIGVTKRIEAFVDYTPALRTNAVNLNPVTYPVPPLDLIIDTYPTRADRSAPYFMFNQEVPYKTYDVQTVRIIPPSWGAFSQSSGDVVVGGKVSLLSEKRGDPLGLGVHGSVAIPTEHPEGNTGNWAHLAGVPGAVDAGVQIAVAKRLKRLELVGNVGFKFVGTPELGGMRVQYVDSSRAGTPGFIVGQPTTVPLKLYDELSFTGGTRMPVFKIRGSQGWVIGELTYTRYVGGGTPVEGIANVTEVRAGVQAEIPGYRNLMVGAAWQYPVGDKGNGDVRTTNFKTPDGRGDINFGQLVDPSLASAVGAYFSQNGVTLASNSSKVFATNNPAFDGWRNVPTAPQTVTAMGNNAIVAYITWRFR